MADESARCGMEGSLSLVDHHLLLRGFTHWHLLFHLHRIAQVRPGGAQKGHAERYWRAPGYPKEAPARYNAFANRSAIFFDSFGNGVSWGLLIMQRKARSFLIQIDTHHLLITNQLPPENRPPDRRRLERCLDFFQA
jgi:hypothetical protein